MADPQALYPLEIVVAGTPISLQSSNRSRERWKATIAAAARMRVSETSDLVFLDDRPLSISIYYFAGAPMRGDIDNIVKPIVDALVRIAYIDDRSVERVVVQKFEPDGERSFAAPSDKLAEALETARPVVYIRVDDDLSWRRL